MALVERLRAAASEVFDRRPVLFAYLYGSRAVGRPRPDSDIDIAVFADPSASASARFELRTSLPHAVERAAGIVGVEVVVLNDAPIGVQGRAIQGISIYSRDEVRRVRYESRTFREFCDFDLHAREDARRMLRDIAEGRR